MTTPTHADKPALPAPFANSRLSKAYENALVVEYDSQSKIAFFSDCHRGVGSNADNFTPNQTIYHGALTYYNRNHYTYFEIGDGDELWENRRLADIVSTHRDTFTLLSEFYKDGRFYMLYGNHDIVKKNPRQRRSLSGAYDDGIRKNGLLFPGIQVYEALLLHNAKTGRRILVTHGHQGDFMNDYLWRVSRFLVRYVWRPLQLIGIQDPTSPSDNSRRRIAREEKLMKWAKENGQMIICGHTHRPHYPERGEPPYFNDGCCVHPHSITAIELEGDKISLVKWTVKTSESLSLYIGREVLYGPKPLERF